MNKPTMIKGAFTTLFLIGMLVLPAAAAQTVQTKNMKENSIDPGLKDDLWANHQQYRLQRFDLNLEQATGIIAILERYGIDATACQKTLSTISSRRSDLEAALEGRDRIKLKSINAELRTLWKQFLKEMREAFREHYSRSTAGMELSGPAGLLPVQDAGL